MVQLSYFNPPGYSSWGVVNTAAWRSAQVPSTNTHATSAGIARVYQGLLEPDLLVSPPLLAEATSAQSVGFCPVLGEEVTRTGPLDSRGTQSRAASAAGAGKKLCSPPWPR